GGTGSVTRTFGVVLLQRAGGAGDRPGDVADGSVRAQHDRRRAEWAEAANRRGLGQREAAEVRVRIADLHGRDVARLGGESEREGDEQPRTREHAGETRM